MRHTFAAAALAAGFFSSLALAEQATCGPNKKCPDTAPCCSLYGQCGVGAYCLGGCDPLFSHTLKSCLPAPVCKDATYTFDNLNDVKGIDSFLGDTNGVNWAVSGKPLPYNGAVLLSMAEGTVGTLMSSTHYVWYGKICAKMTTSQGAGVVTAFIMMSDARDEIDFEWVGVDVQHAQSNYYSQGVTVYTNMRNLSASDTASTVHEYCIDWQQDTLTWSVDGADLRTVKRSDTWNSTAGRFDYPQTPSRVMLSLWPAGLPSNAKGTIDWAGGVIQWNSPYMQNGYYYAMVEEVSVKCYDPPKGADIQGSKSYIYTNEAGTNNTIRITDDEVVLASFYATGDNPDYDPYGAKASASTGSAAPAPTDVETVPGMSGAGNQAAENAGASGTAGAAESTGTSSNGAASTGGFSQGTENSKNGAAETKGKALGSSFFAVWIGVLGLLIL